jgi:hypothetical protein
MIHRLAPNLLPCADLQTPPGAEAVLVMMYPPLPAESRITRVEAKGEVHFCRAKSLNLLLVLPSLRKELQEVEEVVVEEEEEEKKEKKEEQQQQQALFRLLANPLREEEAEEQQQHQKKQ